MLISKCVLTLIPLLFTEKKLDQVFDFHKCNMYLSLCSLGMRKLKNGNAFGLANRVTIREK